MATYTAVLVVPDELEQDAVQAVIERAGVVALLAPGALVDTGDDPGQEIVRTLSMGDMGVRATLSKTIGGPVLQLRGLGCDLAGELPGEYYLVPSGEGALGS